MRVALILIENIVEVYEFPKKFGVSGREKTPHDGVNASEYSERFVFLLCVMRLTRSLNTLC
jgi:hypothetical protein